MYDPIKALRAKFPPPQTLSVKVNCHDVRLLRRVLSARGYGNLQWRDPVACPDVSADYDDKLALIVRNYQREHQLAADGICGPLTWASLADYKTWPAKSAPPKPTREAKLRKAIVKRAASRVGIREETGHNDGADVERILKRAGGVKGEPWCAAFQDCNVEDGYTDCGEHTPYDIGRSCSGIVSRLAERIFTNAKQAKPGDLMIFKGGTGRKVKFNGKATAFCHVGMIEQVLDANGKFTTIEGNTDPGGSSEGDGSYRRLRSPRNCVFFRTV